MLKPETSSDDKTEFGSLSLLCACLVGFAFSASYTNHTPLILPLTKTYDFSLEMAGYLTTGIFSTHAIMQIPGGHLADRLGARPVIAAALAQVCIGNVGIAFASLYWHFLFWKIFVGLGTGICFVAGARYISAAYPGPRAQLAQGCYGGSILLGSGFVIFAVPRLAAAFGWRAGFLATAAVAAATLIVWAAAPSPAKIRHAPVSFGGLITDFRLWQLGLIQMASFGLVIVISSWITTFLQHSFSMNAVTAGLLGSTALLLGIIVRPVGGVLLSRIPMHSLLCISLSFSAAGCMLLAFAADSPARAAIGILMVGVGSGLPYAALFTRAAALFPGRAGAAMGLVNMLGVLMILATPPLIGALVDWSGNFQSSFLALGFFSLASFFGALRIDQPSNLRPY